MSLKCESRENLFPDEAGEEEEKCSLNAHRTYVLHSTSHLSGVLSSLLGNVKKRGRGGRGEERKQGKLLEEAAAFEEGADFRAKERSSWPPLRVGLFS